MGAVIISSGVQVDNVTIGLDSSSKVSIRSGYEQSAIITPIAENNIDIVELQAAATESGVTHDSSVSDTFNDTTGYKNTVQTATTSATFDATKYKATTTVSQDQTTITDIIGTLDATNKGVATSFTASQNYTLKSIQINGTITGNPTVEVQVWGGASDHPTTKLLVVQSKNGLSTGWSTFTHATGVALTKSTKYWVAIVPTSADGSNKIVVNSAPSGGESASTSDGASFTYANEYQLGYQISGTLAANPVIDISLGTITGTVTHTELVINSVDRETGDSITYKLKNATQSDTALAVNTKNTVVNLTTVPTGIEINLNPKSTSPTAGYPSIKSYCLKLFKA